MISIWHLIEPFFLLLSILFLFNLDLGRSVVGIFCDLDSDGQA